MNCKPSALVGQNERPETGKERARRRCTISARAQIIHVELRCNTPRDLMESELSLTLDGTGDNLAFLKALLEAKWRAGALAARRWNGDL
jgi:hypothetical protein